MEVLVFQGAIVATMIVLRLVRHDFLIYAAIGWSGLTLFMVFMPWLIGLQLAVIWVTFAVLHKKEDPAPEVKNEAISYRKEPSEGIPDDTSSKSSPVQPAVSPAAKPISPPTEVAPPARSPIAQPLPSEPKAQEQNKQSTDRGSSFLSELNAGLKTLNEGLEKFADSSKRKLLLLEATGDIRFRISHEKNIIKQSLKSAEQQVELDREMEDPVFAECYNEVRGKMSSRTEPVRREPIGSVLDDFVRGELISGRMTETGDSVDDEVKRLLAEHKDYVQETALLLSRQSKLRARFDETMVRLGGSDISKLMDHLVSNHAALARLKSISPPAKPKKNPAKRSKPVPKTAAPLLSPRKPEKKKTATTQEAAKSTSQSDPVTLSSDISKVIQERRIPYLVHFTQAENLFSILRYGLVPVEAARTRGIKAKSNDKDRLDGHLDATSLSIAFPNVSMFWKYRRSDPTKDWCVLVLDPSILSKKACLFCRHNAATKVMRNELALTLESAEGLRNMFADAEGFPARSSSGLASYFPIDEQAEILVKGVIEPRFITAVAFESQRAADRHASFPHGMDVIIHPNETGLFGNGRKLSAPALEPLPY